MENFLLQRILNVEYSFPPHVNVSPECRDLLSRLLVADPRSRISMDGIWRHPWFQQNLPQGVAEMNLHLLKNPETFSGLGQQVGSSSRAQLTTTLLLSANKLDAFLETTSRGNCIEECMQLEYYGWKAAEDNCCFSRRYFRCM